MQHNENDAITSLRQFVMGQRVLVRNYSQGPMWVSITVVKKSDSMLYVVQIMCLGKGM